MTVKDKTVKRYFEEEQSMRNSLAMWSFYLMFVILVGTSFWGLYQQVVLGKPFGNHPTSNADLELFFILSFIVMMAVVVFVNRMSLVTIIDETGIRFRFSFIMKQKYIAKEEIIRYEVRKYKALKEYGGWGCRKRSVVAFVRQRVGVAYSIKGNMGLQLYLTNGSKILIGTQKPAGVERAMKRLMNEGGIADG